jgi:hypothetical protein
MTAPTAWPPPQHNEALPQAGGDPPGPPGPPAWTPPQARRGPESAHETISEIADLVRNTRISVLADAGLLGTVLFGLAAEAGLSARAHHPVVAGTAAIAALSLVLACWAVAACVLARASRPVINAVSELRWVTGAPVDPRPGWVTLPPAGADPAQWTWNRAYLLLGAARLARYRMQLADTWTYLAGGGALLWTVLLLLGR